VGGKGVWLLELVRDLSKATIMAEPLLLLSLCTWKLNFLQLAADMHKVLPGETTT
jgi:hypothetical protein